MSEPKPTYKAWFKIPWSGNDPKWYSNHVEFDTKEEATEHALFKYDNWTQSVDWTVTETGVDPNETKGE